MAAQNVVVEKRLADIEMSDDRLVLNDTGRTLYQNEIVLVPLGTNRGMAVLVNVLDNTGIVANGSYYTGIVKMIVNVPCSATAFTAGQAVQLAQSGTGATHGSTVAGTYVIGQATKVVATSASYVPVDLNFGPDAFYVA